MPRVCSHPTHKQSDYAQVVGLFAFHVQLQMYFVLGETQCFKNARQSLLSPFRASHLFVFLKVPRHCLTVSLRLALNSLCDQAGLVNPTSVSPSNHQPQPKRTFKCVQIWSKTLMEVFRAV